MTQKMDRLLSDRISQFEARLCRLEGSANKLVELTEQRELRVRQQRDRNLSAIVETLR